MSWLIENLASLDKVLAIIEDMKVKDEEWANEKANQWFLFGVSMTLLELKQKIEELESGKLR